MSRTPPAELTLDEPGVARLIATQAPEFSGQPITVMDHGWDNALYKLGNAFIVRLPRRSSAVALVHHEQRLLPLLAPSLPTNIPVPVVNGVATERFPWPWSIVPWFDGLTLNQIAHLPNDTAHTLAITLGALHSITLGEQPPQNPYRGVALRARTDAFASRAAELDQAGEALTEQHQAIWRAALVAQPPSQACWLHGDLHGKNIIAKANGTLVAILDWGDITRGDAATDVATLWLHFDDRVATSAYSTYCAARAHAEDWDALKARAKGWALFFAVLLRASGASGLADNPTHAAMGASYLARLSERR